MGNKTSFALINPNRDKQEPTDAIFLTNPFFYDPLASY